MNKTIRVKKICKQRDSVVNLGIVIIYTMCNCDSEYKLDKITFVDKKNKNCLASRYFKKTL